MHNLLGSLPTPPRQVGARPPMRFLKEKQISKEWRTMKITIDFENGMEVNLKPENLQLVDIKAPTGELAVAVGFKTDVAQVPFLFFPNLQLATKEELAIRKAIADPDKQPPAQPPAPPAEPTGGAVNPPAPEPPATPAA